MEATVADAEVVVEVVVEAASALAFLSFLDGLEAAAPFTSVAVSDMLRDGVRYRVWEALKNDGY